MASKGMNQSEIGAEIGVGQSAVSALMLANGIKTAMMQRGRKGFKQSKIDPFRKPVHPTESALRAVSVFNLGGCFFMEAADRDRARAQA